MAWYALSYDLRNDASPAAYARTAEALQSGGFYCKPLLSFWIIRTSLTPSQIIARLLSSGALHDADGIVILETNMRGNFRRVSHLKGVVEWMRKYIIRI